MLTSADGGIDRIGKISVRIPRLVVSTSAHGAVIVRDAVTSSEVSGVGSAAPGNGGVVSHCLIGLPAADSG